MSIKHLEKCIKMPEVAVQTSFYEAEVKHFNHASEALADLNIGECLDKRFCARVLRRIEVALTETYTKHATAGEYPAILQNYPIKEHMPFTKPPKIAQENGTYNVVVFSDAYHNDPWPLQRLAEKLGNRDIKIKGFVKNYPKLDYRTAAHKMGLKKSKLINDGYEVIYRGCLYGFSVEYNYSYSK